MRKFRSARGKNGQLPINFRLLPERVRRIFGSAFEQLGEATAVQLELATEVAKINASAELTAEGKAKRIAALREERVPKLRDHLARGRDFMQKQVDEIEADVTRSLSRHPLGELPKLPDGASLEARLTRQNIGATQELLLEQRRRRVEDDVDAALAKDASGGELMRLAGLALGSGDALDAYLWETAAPERVRRFGGKAAQVVIDDLAKAARERRLEQINDQGLLEELDHAPSLGSAVDLARMLGEAVEREDFSERQGAHEVRSLRMGLGALEVVWDDQQS